MSADQARRPFEPADITRIAWVGDAQISPDGSVVAYTSTHLSVDEDEYLTNIWVTSVHSGEARQFTRGSKRDTSPRWSPDGRWLAFLSTRGNDLKPQLYVMPAGGGEASALTHLPGGASNIEWSPDSSRIAFLSSISDTSANADSGEHSKSRPARIITTLRYKYNGEGFIHDTHPHIFTVGISGGEPQQLTSGNWNAVAPRWSPDGARLAFLAARHADRDYDNAVDIWVMPSEGGEATQLTATAEAISSLAFSPDGNHIAYIGDRFPNDGGRHQRLFILPSTGGTGRCLTDSLDRSFVPSDASLAWPAASTLYGLIRTEGCVHIYRVVTGSEPHASAVITGLRQVSDFSLSQNGQLIAFTASSAAAPAEVFLCRADGSDEHQLTHCNDVWLDQVELMAHEEFHFERNGFTVQG
ncbi:MAG: hypothetical protein M1118_07140 [Chloroflexi bacterium]|nr:hypothetical protein [Chloroflexota bacterium]